MGRALLPLLRTGMLLAVVCLPGLARAQWPAELPLRRGIFEVASGDSLSAVLRLEEMDARAGDEEQARAAALLAQLYAELGDARFTQLVASQWNLPAPVLRQHLASLWLRGALAGRVDEPLPTTEPLPAELRTLAAAAEIDRGDFARAREWLDESMAARGDRERAIASYLQAVADEALGLDPTLALRECAERNEGTLTDAAALWLATLAHERGEDPLPWLSRLDGSQTLSSRALHMRAMLAFDAGDFEQADALLQRVAQDPDYAHRRDLLLALGALFLEQNRQAEALAAYTTAEEAWRAEDGALAGFEASADPQRALEGDAAWKLDDAALVEAGTRRLTDWSDLRRPLPTASTPNFDLTGEGAGRPNAPTLSAEELLELRALLLKGRHAEADARRYERIAEEERERNRSAERYRAKGMDALSLLNAPMRGAAAELDSIAGQLDEVLRRLNAVTDTEIERIRLRTRRMSEHAQRNARRMTLFEQLYVHGPMARLDQRLHPETPRPAELFELDRALADSLDRFQGRFAADMPRLITRSRKEILEPRLVGDAPQLRSLAHALLDRGDLLYASLDSSRAAVAANPQLAEAEASALSARARVAQAYAEHDRLRRLHASAALARSRARLAEEREGIAYGLAASSYGVAADLADAGIEDESAVAARRKAIGYLQDFLSGYAESFARGESRFRLADLLLLEARDEFHAAMDAYLQTKRGLPPQLDYSAALSLYRQILEEDVDYAHRDAAQFHLAMILADEGDPAAAGALDELLLLHPDTEFAQAAHHRRADLAFDDAEFELAARNFELAARGEDIELRAMSLYKLGWCHSNRDRHFEAAEAFAQLLDLYAGGFPAVEKLDLQQEARDDLVHALARAGGASAFERFLAGSSGREYAPKILASLSQLLRNYSLFDEAIDSDELYLRLYALRPGALDAGRRLLDSHRRHSEQAEIDRMQLALAERFQPGAEWYAAQSDSLLQSEASQFARGGVRAAALRAHRDAKEKETGDWSLALGYYRTLLKLWPQDGEAPRFSLLAGECALESRSYEEAISHFAAAAASDTASFREDAAWLGVVSCERWYESSRAADAQLGDDALAKRLLSAGVDYLEEYPTTERAADLRWRAGNLRFVHGWYEESAARLEEFVQMHPQDTRALKAATLAGEASYRLERFDRAAVLYAQALEIARSKDAQPARLLELIPHCLYRHAEQTAENDGAKAAAPLFASLATEWPSFQHTPEALYRAGDGYLAAGETALALSQWERLVAYHRRHELAPDAMRRICKQLQRDERPVDAAKALARYAELFPDETDAGEALLLAATLYGDAGDTEAKRSLEDRYLDAHPEDKGTALALREARAREEIGSLGSASIQTLIAADQPTELMRYLQLVEASPDEAAPEILAEIAFRKADESRANYESIRLTQPLEKSLQTKKDRLESLLAGYGECAKQSVRPWAQASAYRIGEALVHFGQSLEKAEAPADLSEEDLGGFREILAEQAWEFYGRGEEAWTQLLRDSSSPDDATRPWIEKTQESLYPRIAARFIHRPEAVHPRLRAEAPLAAR